MRAIWNRLPLFLIVAGVALLASAAACSGDDDDGGDDGGNAGGTTVDVVLSEFVIAPDPASVPAGEVTFKATNEGEEKHEMVIVKTDLASDSLPTKADGAADEEGAGVELINEIEEFDAGGSEELTVSLEAGNYVLFCNIVEEDEAHYEEGMHTSFTVE